MSDDLATVIKSLNAEKMIAEMNGMTGVSTRLQAVVECLEVHECAQQATE